MDAVDLSDYTKLTCPICGNVWYEKEPEEFPDHVLCHDCQFPNVYFQGWCVFKFDYNGEEKTIRVNKVMLGNGVYFIKDNQIDCESKDKIQPTNAFGMSGGIIDLAKLDNGRIILFKFDENEYQDFNEIGVFEKVPMFPVEFDDFPEIKEKLSRLERFSYRIGITTSDRILNLTNFRMETEDGEHYEFDFYLLSISCKLTNKCRSTLIYPTPTSGFDADGNFFHEALKKSPNFDKGYRIRCSDTSYSIERIRQHMYFQN